MARVIADTSVWVAYFRGVSSQATHALDQLLIDGFVDLNAIIRAEILSGAKNDPHYRHLEMWLSALALVPESQGFWDRLALTRYQLKRRGHQMAVPDLYVALTTHESGRELLTLDHDFITIQKIIPFKRFQP